MCKRDRHSDAAIYSYRLLFHVCGLNVIFSCDLTMQIRNIGSLCIMSWFNHRNRIRSFLFLVFYITVTDYNQISSHLICMYWNVPVHSKMCMFVKDSRSYCRTQFLKTGALNFTHELRQDAKMVFLFFYSTLFYYGSYIFSIRFTYPSHLVKTSSLRLWWFQKDFVETESWSISLWVQKVFLLLRINI